MSDVFANGVKCVIPTLKPKDHGWEELPCDPKYSLGYPCRAYIHTKHNLFVMSAVEVATDKDGIDRGFEYHISISKPVSYGVTSRCDSGEAKWVLDQFGLDGAEEDNHVPYGKVRNFWRTVATGMIGLECACKAEESVIMENKGDFVWRP